MIQPNSKYQAGSLTISCYGKGMIMVDHVTLTAPIPIGPTDEEAFWSKEPEDRLGTVLDYIVHGITPESDPDAISEILSDVDRARQEIDEYASD